LWFTSTNRFNIKAAMGYGRVPAIISVFCFIFLGLLVLAGEPTRALEGNENPWTVSFEGAGLTLEGGRPCWRVAKK
jgi:hypothetical protein